MNTSVDCPEDVEVLLHADRSHPLHSALVTAGLAVRCETPSATPPPPGEHRFVIHVDPVDTETERAALSSEALLCTVPRRLADDHPAVHGLHALFFDPGDRRGVQRLIEHLRYLSGCEPARRALVAAASDLVVTRRSRAGTPMLPDVSNLTTPALEPTTFPPPTPGRATPDFLGIGAQKSGTTWLAAQLATRPDVHLPAAKELHFFDREHASGFDWYHDQLEGGTETVSRGEITPAYAILPDSDVAQIRAMFPECRIFFTVRNPIERAWSAARMEIARAALPHGISLDDVAEHVFVDFLLQAEVDAKSRYCETIERWSRHFGDEQFLLLFFDDILERPDQVMTTLAHHLELPPFAHDHLDRVVNPGEALAIPAAVADLLHRLYDDEVRRLEELSGRRLDHWIAPASPPSPNDARTARHG